MLQQEVTAFSGSDLDEPRSLELPDDFGPRHIASVNLSLGYVNTHATQTTTQSKGAVSWLDSCVRCRSRMPASC